MTAKKNRKEGVARLIPVSLASPPDSRPTFCFQPPSSTAQIVSTDPVFADAHLVADHFLARGVHVVGC